jgi:DNA-binding NarL/FixJ family response regulator
MMVVDGNPAVTPYGAFAAYRRHWPDVVVMDLGTPPRDGVWGTRQILSLDPRAVVAVLTH